MFGSCFLSREKLLEHPDAAPDTRAYRMLKGTNFATRICTATPLLQKLWMLVLRPTPLAVISTPWRWACWKPAQAHPARAARCRC